MKNCPNHALRTSRFVRFIEMHAFIKKNITLYIGGGIKKLFFLLSVKRGAGGSRPNPTPRNALFVGSLVGHVFYAHLTRLLYFSNLVNSISPKILAVFQTTVRRSHGLSPKGAKDEVKPARRLFFGSFLGRFWAVFGPFFGGFKFFGHLTS